tara:strand:- start:4582 stop:6195 length:1614 start_codon:yes stop_codon:yes gene_type:complete
MKVLVSFLFIFTTLHYSLDLELLPNPFSLMGNQETFIKNSSRWVEQFALNSTENNQYKKALHAWCYLQRFDHPTAKNNIISLLDRLNKPLLKIIFIAHYDGLESLNLDYDSKQNVKQFLNYLILREKLFRGMRVSKNEFQSNKYSLSEYFYQRNELTNQKYYLQNKHLDPYQIFNYHRLRSRAIKAKFRLRNETLIIKNDYFLPHAKTFNQFNYGLDNGDKNQILMDAEHLSFLIRTTDYVPPDNLVKKYPYLILSLLSKSQFVFTSNYWDAFLKILSNPFWLPKVKHVVNNNLHLQHSLKPSLSYLFPKLFSEITHLDPQNLIHTEPGIKFIYSSNLPTPLLNRAISASKKLNFNPKFILPIRWSNLTVPFVFDPIESELIVSTQSVFWSEDVWLAVLLRNKLYLRLLNYILRSVNAEEPLPALWLIDSIVNSKTIWTPSLHGLNYKQVQYLSLFPLSLTSLYESSRNRARKNLFYTYHWQCKKIGELLFNSMKLSEILNKLEQLKVSSENPRMLYQRLSIYFNAPIEQLHNLIPQ